jgi:hypothetical protein
MTYRDEEEATQAFADYLRRQDWAPRIPTSGNDTVDAALNTWWVGRAEDCLDTVAEIGARLWGDTGLDDDEIEVLKGRIDAALFTSVEIRDPELVSERVLDAVKGFINGQVV